MFGGLQNFAYFCTRKKQMNNKHHIVVNTPVGRYTIEKKDGGISFMGMSAKVVSAKNGVYKIKSSLGNFTVNARKGTVVKN